MIMRIVSLIQKIVADEVTGLYQYTIAPADITVNETKPDFEGDYTVVLFALTKSLKKSPEMLARELGDRIVTNNQGVFSSFNVIKGFLNLSIGDHYWTNFLLENYS